MILITVGTTPFPFSRMNILVYRLLSIKRKKELIIYQHGATYVPFSANNLILRQSLPYHLLTKYMKESRIIITHGGPASIYQSLSFGKIPYVLPREKKFGEHINDHQKLFFEYLKNKGFVFSTSIIETNIKRKQHTIHRSITNINNLVNALDKIIK